jgi:hypothetical protein
VVALGSERHGFLRPTAALWCVVAVDLADLGEDTAAGGAAQVEAILLQGGVHPEGADLRVPCQLPDLLDGREGHLPHPDRSSIGFVCKTFRAFLLEPPQDLVDGGASHAEMTGDGLRAPAVHAQLHDGRSSLARRSRLHLMVARVAPLQLQRQSFLVENPLYGTHVGLSAEAGAYYVGYLVEVEGRVLGLEVHDETANVGRELSPFGLLGSEQALHPFVLEAPYPAPQRGLGDAGLPGALCYG